MRKRSLALSWRVILISNPAKLCYQNGALVVQQDHNYRVPVEDISSIIVDNPQVIITQPLLSKAAEYGIAIFSTDNSHLPNGIFLPFAQHHNSLNLVNLQINCKKPVLKRLRTSIIVAKIQNQAQCLRINKLEGADGLDCLAKEVRSGDPDNIEAKAAMRYFKFLFGKSFARNDELSNINSCLNYGYAVIRGEIARRLVGHGLFPPIGIFHCNKKNPFNLADDLIEPFRPIVDIFTEKFIKNCNNQDFILPKASLVSLLNYEVSMPEGKMAISLAIEYVIESYVRILSNETKKLSLPNIENFIKHEYTENMS